MIFMYLETLLGWPRCRHEDSIEINFKEIELEGVDCIGVGVGRDKWPGFWSMEFKIRVP